VEASPPPIEPPTTDILDETPATRERNAYRLQSGIILSRPPLLTRPLLPFESAFFFYQKRLNERLAAGFRRQLYFKTDTTSDLDWRIKLRERKGTVGKDVGVYNGHGRHAWNDELLVGSTLSDPEVLRNRLLGDAELRVSEDGIELPETDRVPVEQPLPRLTEADLTKDVRRLDRKLDETLYLVVESGEGWGFPASVVRKSENLHEVCGHVRIRLRVMLTLLTHLTVPSRRRQERWPQPQV